MKKYLLLLMTLLVLTGCSKPVTQAPVIEKQDQSEAVIDMEELNLKDMLQDDYDKLDEESKQALEAIVTKINVEEKKKKPDNSVLDKLYEALNNKLSEHLSFED